MKENSRIFPVLLFFITLLPLVPTPTLAFTNLDSLKIIVSRETKDKTSGNLLRLAARTSLKDLNLALAYINIALDNATKENNHLVMFDIQREMGLIYEENNHIENALYCYKSCLDISEKINNKALKLTILTDLAIVHEKMSKYAIAKDYHLRAIELAKNEGDNETEENAYHGLGSLYETVGDYDKAIDYYLQSLTIAESRNSTEGRVITLQSIANTYNHVKDKNQSLQTIERAYQLAMSMEDEKLISGTLYDYGRILNSFGDYEQALEKQQESLARYRKTEDGIGISRGLVSIGEIYTHLGNYTEAEKYLKECFDFEKYLSAIEHSRLYNKLGKLYIEQDNIDEAEIAFHKSLELSEKGDFNGLNQQNNKDLYKVHQKKGEFQEALTYLEAYSQFSDYIHNENRTDRMTELQFKFDVEKNESEFQALSLRQNQIMFMGASIFFISLILVLIYVIRLKGRNHESLVRKSEEIKAQNIKLAENNEVLSQFVYVAAHDLKEPLRNIGSFVSLIQRKYGKQFNEEANQYMGYVTSGVTRMNNLLGDLLQYSRITAQAADDEETVLNDILEEVRCNLREKIMRTEAVFKIPQNDINLRMSRIHLLQLLQNLVSNGMKFMPPGRTPIIRVMTRIEADFVTIMVEDNGIGINKDYEHKVFNLFHQLDKKAKYEGTGIGLTICKNIVDKYNGKIWFESELGEGTTFFITLPVAMLLTSNTPAIEEGALLEVVH